MELPCVDQNTISVLITDLVHYVARYMHHDFLKRGCLLHVWSVRRTSAEAGRIEAWVFKEDITDEHKQGALFIAMTGWMVIVKPVEDLKNNYVYIEKRWKAALIGLGLTDLICTTSKKDLLLYISETMNRSRGIRDISMRTFILARQDSNCPWKPLYQDLLPR